MKLLEHTAPVSSSLYNQSVIAIKAFYEGVWRLRFLAAQLQRGGRAVAYGAETEKKTSGSQRRGQQATARRVSSGNGLPKRLRPPRNRAQGDTART